MGAFGAPPAVACRRRHFVGEPAAPCFRFLLRISKLNSLDRVAIRQDRSADVSAMIELLAGPDPARGSVLSHRRIAEMTERISLAGKVAVVTGAGRGLGGHTSNFSPNAAPGSW